MYGDAVVLSREVHGRKVQVEINDQGCVAVSGATMVDVIHHLDAKDGVLVFRRAESQDYIAVRSEIINGSSLQISLSRKLGKSWWNPPEPRLALKIALTKFQLFFFGPGEKNSPLAEMDIEPETEPASK